MAMKNGAVRRRKPGRFSFFPNPSISTCSRKSYAGYRAPRHDPDFHNEAVKTVRFFLAYGLCVSLSIASAAVGATTPPDEDTVIAQSLAEMLRDARTVVSNNQDLINNPELGDKHLNGRVVLDQTVTIYQNATGSDPTRIDPNSRQGRLLRAMMAAIVTVTDDNQATINMKGTGFKGFIPAVFARLVGEDFNQRAKGEAKVKVTAPPELVRNRKARPDAWEADIMKTKLLTAAWPKGAILFRYRRCRRASRVPGHGS